MGAVPVHGLPEPRFDRCRRAPAQSRELGGVERIATVVPRPVVDEANQALRLSESREHLARDQNVLRLVAARDVVGLSGLAGLEQEIDRGRVIFDEEPVAHVASVSVERQRLIIDRVGDEERDELLGVLVGAVVVRRARHDDRHSVGSPVGEGQAVSSGLGRRVRVAGIQRRGLREGSLGDRAVDLVRRDLDELGDASLFRLFQQHEDPAHVRFDERGVAQE